ncbi:MAG TPA: glutamate formimidoyltransferase [Gemmatimonadales bacterium]|jgi:glutamate formiminotransferase/formiminotetrahydrofolate cyclodeaminase|nr:glutamate formimidoyltransferase [Gemmatimonadales bacterium]
MASPLVECVPNFSEGRDSAVLDALRAAIVAVPGVRLLDVQADPSHNRSVFTFVAPPPAALEAAFRAMQAATARIDLRRHAGEHPRMGATDVVPFVPVRDVTMNDCVSLARQLGERVGRELEIPVFLYAKAAARPERERLPDIRKGEFEGLKDRIGADAAADPDFGPNRIHPTAGATAIGARPFLVAYNIYLDTPDVAIAKEIAKKIRTSSGGLPAVQASGFEVGGKAQVSMNLLDIDETPPAKVFEVVKAEAATRGVKIDQSEIVGLIPERAILGAAGAALQLPDAADHLLEARIREAQGPTLDGWLEELAGGAPVPGGGSAAALAGALAGGLVAMVARLTVGKKAYAAAQPRAREIEAEADRLRAELRRLVDEDAAAYGGVNAAYKIPKDHPGRVASIDAALVEAARVPLEVARRGARIFELAKEIANIGNKNAVSDARVAELLARAAVEGAVQNVLVNVNSLSDPAAGRELLDEAKRLASG